MDKTYELLTQKLKAAVKRNLVRTFPMAGLTTQCPVCSYGQRTAAVCWHWADIVF